MTFLYKFTVRNIYGYLRVQYSTKETMLTRKDIKAWIEISKKLYHIKKVIFYYNSINFVTVTNIYVTDFLQVTA